MPRLYRAPQVCALTGATYRQVDYWCRRGYLVEAVAAQGSGSQRLFDPVAVTTCAVMVRLTGGGLDVGRAAEIAHALVVDGQVEHCVGPARLVLERKAWAVNGVEFEPGS